MRIAFVIVALAFTFLAPRPVEAGVGRFVVAKVAQASQAVGKGAVAAVKVLW